MSTIYWIEMLGRIHVILFIFGIFLPILAFFCFLSSIDNDDSEKYKKASIRLLFASLACWLLFLFIPNAVQAYRIYGIGSIIENPNAKHLPDKTLKILNKWADNYLEKDSTNINK